MAYFDHTYALNLGGTLPVTARAYGEGSYTIELSAKTADVIGNREAILGLASSIAGVMGRMLLSSYIPTTMPTERKEINIFGVQVAYDADTTSVVFGSISEDTIRRHLLVHEVEA